MTQKEKALKICDEAVGGKMSLDSFYDKLSAVAEDTRTDEDLACLIEDVLMEIEMEGGGRKMAIESAKRLSSEISENIEG